MHVNHIIDFEPGLVNQICPISHIYFGTGLVKCALPAILYISTLDQSVLSAILYSLEQVQSNMSYQPYYILWSRLGQICLISHILQTSIYPINHIINFGLALVKYVISVILYILNQVQQASFADKCNGCATDTGVLPIIITLRPTQNNWHVPYDTAVIHKDRQCFVRCGCPDARIISIISYEGKTRPNQCPSTYANCCRIRRDVGNTY